MTQYAALLRGIGPGNPNMSNENLRKVCNELGFDEVQTVISSGNIVFATDPMEAAELESVLESAWPEQLGFESTTIIRSREELEGLVELDPFDSRKHTKETYLLTTFAKGRFQHDLDFPLQPKGKDYVFVSGTDRELFSVTDTVHGTSLDVMSWLENRFGKEITSRTWLTVSRILNRMRH